LDVSESKKKNMKYYALTSMGRVHFVALGRCLDFEAAQEVANSFIVRNTTEEMVPNVLQVIDEWEMRSLLGEMIKPIYVGPTRKKSSKREVEVASEEDENGEQETLPAFGLAAPVVDVSTS
jgi:hypothetical protein